MITQDHFLDRHQLPHDQRATLRKGILSKETAVGICGTNRAETFIKIMEKFDMLVPCEVNMDGKEGVAVYLIPCLLQKVADDQIKPPDKRVPRLHFKFTPATLLQSEGFLPPGLFHRLMSCCCRTKKWIHYAELIFYDYMEFGADKFGFALHMSRNGITVSAFEFEGLLLSRALNAVCKELQSEIDRIIGQLFPNLACVTYVECPCTPLAQR